MPSSTSSTTTMTTEQQIAETRTSPPSHSRHRQWLVLGVLASVNLCLGVTLSCIVPFFPGQAKAKGLSTVEIGFLIGFYQLCMAISSPLLGQSMAFLGPHRLFSAGLCLCACAVVCFGFLPMLPSASAFFWAALMLRALMALGFAGFKTSQMAMLAQTFPASLASTIGLLEVFSGLSYSLGPVLGSALTQLGGFSAPFATFGLVMFLAGLASIWLLSMRQTPPTTTIPTTTTTSRIVVDDSTIDNDDDADAVPDGQKSGIKAALAVPEVWLTSLGLATLMLCAFFYDASLAEHLTQVDPSPMLTGSLISITAVMSMLMSPVWGLLVDRMSNSREGTTSVCPAEAIMLLGAVGGATFALMIGPSPLIGFIRLSLPLLSVAFAIQGIALAAFSTPSLRHCLWAAGKRGLNTESAAICGSISGILQGSISLGAFLGNSLGGLSVQCIGFPWTGTVAAALQLPFILGLLCFRARHLFVSRQQLCAGQQPPAAAL